MNVIVVGSLNIDLTSYVNIFPRPGETIIGNQFRITNGGKGMNCCVAASHLFDNSNNNNEYVAMVGCIGNDVFGERLLKSLNENNINSQYIYTSNDNISTGVAQINVDQSGENSIIIVPGANHILSIEHINEALPNLLNNNNKSVLICQLEILPDITLQAMEMARSINDECIILFNPSPINHEIFQNNNKFYTLPDIFCINIIELALLSNKNEINDLNDIRDSTQYLKTLGVNNIIVTRGADGIYVLTKENEEHIININQSIDVLDTVGAGDCFAGSLASILSQGNDLIYSIKKASFIASLSVTKLGAQSSYLNYNEIEEKWNDNII